jgi:hypothetical protein
MADARTGLDRAATRAATRAVKAACVLVAVAAMAGGSAMAQGVAGPMASIVAMVQHGDASALRAAVRGIAYPNGQPIDAKALVDQLHGCRSSQVEEAQPSSGAHGGYARATFICGTQCGAPAYTLRAQPVDGGNVLILGRFNFIRRDCGTTIAPPPAPPRLN